MDLPPNHPPRDASPSDEAREAASLAAELRTVFEQSPTGILVMDLASRRILDANPRALTMFGYTRDEIRRLSIVELTAPPDRETTQRNAAALASGAATDLTVEKQYLRKDGSSFWAEVVASALIDRHGERSRSLAHFIDITARKEAQAKAKLWLQAFERSEMGFVISDAVTNRLIDVNPAFAARRGYTVAEMRGMSVHQVYAPNVAPPFADPAHRLDSRGHVVVESEHVCRDGSTFPVLLDATIIADDQGRPLMRIASVLDITERKRAEVALRIAAVAFESQEAILITDADGSIERVNQAFSQLTGHAPADAVGRRPDFLASERHDPAFFVQIHRHLHQRGYWHGEMALRRRDGRPFTARATITAVRDDQGAVRHFVGTMADVTAERAATARAEHLTHFDPLTGLPNRALLIDRIELALATQSRAGSFGALLLFDLDHFKKINDSIGHRAGDAMLVEAARRLSAALDGACTLARFSGDGFAVVVPDMGFDRTGAAQRAAELAHRLRATMAPPFALGERRVHGSASIGVTVLGGREHDAGTVLQQAELAMYRAKAAGRDCVRLFEQQMQLDLDARNRTEAELREAIANEQLRLHYQLQVDAAGRVRGAEALVRWQHPERGLIPPGAFIAIAEDSGLIEPLGRWVLEQACAQAARWGAAEATRGLVVAINVSARQFKSPTLVDDVLRALRVSAARARQIKLEITESAALEDIDDSIAKLDTLRRHGVSVSLDDFGTGNSSLAYLTRLPLDQLKIDKSFVDELPDGRQASMVAQAIIAMGKGLGMEVIAEGVETAEQFRWLRDSGCDVFQGYLFSRPAPADALAELLARTTPWPVIATP